MKALPLHQPWATLVAIAPKQAAAPQVGRPLPGTVRGLPYQFGASSPGADAPGWFREPGQHDGLYWCPDCELHPERIGGAS